MGEVIGKLFTGALIFGVMRNSDKWIIYALEK